MQWSYGAQSQEHDGVLQGPAAPIRLHRTHTLAAKARGTDTPQGRNAGRFVLLRPTSCQQWQTFRASCSCVSVCLTLNSDLEYLYGAYGARVSILMASTYSIAVQERAILCSLRSRSDIACSCFLVHLNCLNYNN
jgi:hypothetical protein